MVWAILGRREVEVEEPGLQLLPELPQRGGRAQVPGLGGEVGE